MAGSRAENALILHSIPKSYSNNNSIVLNPFSQYSNIPPFRYFRQGAKDGKHSNYRSIHGKHHKRSEGENLGLCDNYCNAGWLPMSKIAECYSAVTGVETSPEDLKKAGERICNLNKLLNVREGFSRADDIVPSWFILVETPDGVVKMKDYYKEKTLSKDDVMKLIDDYYDERGWDREKGVPTEEKLSELYLQEYIP